MKALSLKAQFARLNACPLYLPQANQLTDSQAQTIARSFGDCLEFVQSEFKQANEISAKIRTLPDTRGNGVSLYLNAERLFRGYLYEIWRCADCESREAARHEEFD